MNDTNSIKESTKISSKKIIDKELVTTKTLKKFKIKGRKIKVEKKDKVEVEKKDKVEDKKKVKVEDKKKGKVKDNETTIKKPTKSKISNEKKMYDEDSFQLFIDNFNSKSDSIINIKRDKFINSDPKKTNIRKIINEKNKRIIKDDSEDKDEKKTRRKLGKKKWEYCSNCKDYKVIEKSGFLRCTICGLNCGIILSDGQEWRFYGQYDNKSNNPARCDLPTNELLPNISMGSVIGSGYKPNSSNMKKVINSHKWNSITYKDSAMLKSFMNISNVCSSNNINNCIAEDAKKIYKLIKDEKLCKKSKRLASEAACLRKALEKNSVKRNNDEISIMFGISIHELRKAWQELELLWSIIEDKEEFNDDSYSESDQDESDADDNADNKSDKDITDIIFDLEINDTLSILHRNCNELNLSEEIYEIFKNVYKYVVKKNILIHHTPMSRMGGIIYYTSDLLNISININKTKNLCGISGITINKCAKHLDKYRDELVKNTVLKKYVSL